MANKLNTSVNSVLRWGNKISIPRDSKIPFIIMQFEKLSIPVPKELTNRMEWLNERKGK
jgi:hypothetical protein